MNEMLGIVASKYDGELAGTEFIINLSANSTATATLTVPLNSLFYLMEFSALSTTSDTVTKIRDQTTNTIYAFDETPDTNTKVVNYPFLKTAHKKKITILMENNAGVSSTITFSIYGLLIPEYAQRDFENHLYELAGFKKDDRGVN